jgi:hypothetical protein
MLANYSFVASSKTITLSDYTTIRLDRILLIVNVTRNVIYYNFADATLGASVATNVVTLTNVSTSGHADADKLAIFYDVLLTDPVATVGGATKLSYGTEAQAVTCTLTSLASSATAGREGLVVSNLVNQFTDVLVYAHVKLDSGTIGNDKRTYVWAYGTVDSATPLYPDTITGADAAITFNSPTNLRLLGIIECPAQSTTYKAGPWSLAQLFGTVPEKWGIAVQNYTNIALTAVAGDHKVLYQGVNGKLV